MEKLLQLKILNNLHGIDAYHSNILLIFKYIQIDFLIQMHEKNNTRALKDEKKKDEVTANNFQ